MIGAGAFNGVIISGNMWHGPVKRSVTIAGHQTSISLEPIFWEALRAEAASLDIPINALIARIDAARIDAEDPPNLGSAIRLWLFVQSRKMDAVGGDIPG